jgi:hypothetical protein
MGGKERMAQFPPLVAEDITLKGGGKFEAVADIKFSSAGIVLLFLVYSVVVVVVVVVWFWFVLCVLELPL